jgi:P4 family phage/plasmid primase-like protien
MSENNNKITILDHEELNSDNNSINDALDIEIEHDDDEDILLINNKVHTTSKIIDTNDVKKYKNLMDFINKHKCQYGDKTYTHTWWDNRTNIVFKVGSDEYLEYLDVYSNELNNMYGELHVMEKPLDVGPLCLDYDIKLGNGIRCFEKINVIFVVKAINEIIKKYYTLSEEEEELVCYVLVKNKPYYDENKQVCSDGFHIQYPNLIMDYKDRFIIYEQSKKEIINQGYFDELFKILLKNNLETDTNKKYEITKNDEFVDSDGNVVSASIKKKLIEQIISELFDSSVIKRNSWFSYGSGKRRPSGVYFYEVLHVFDPEINEYEEIPNKQELAKILSIRNENLIPIKSKLNLDKLYETIIPKYVKTMAKKPDIKGLFIKNSDSTDNADNSNNINNQNFKDNRDNREEIKIKHNNEKNDTDTDLTDDVSMAKKLIKLLNKKRAGPYNEWITVGWTLFNISVNLLPEFIFFSKQDNKKYQEGCCEKIWDECSRRITEGGYTIASLHMWAKEDNPEEYMKLIRANVNKLLEEANIKTDYDIALILREMYRHEFKCTSISGNIWWQFENHRWKKIDGAYTFGIKMSEEVARQFAELSASYMRESITCSGQKADILLRKSGDIVKLIIDLKKTAYKERIIRECSSLFYDCKFEDKLDDNPYLIGFDNGVYDLRTGLFRNGCPDDYMSFTTGYDYEVKYSQNSPDIVAIEKFIRSIHPADDLRKYVMCFLASILEGGNTDQKMFFWTGSGSNGKGTLIDLLDHTFGDYYGTLPVTLLTVKRKGSSNATPELADKKGKRVLIMQEPDQDDELNVGFLKELTGQDKIMARALYGQPCYYIPQFTPIVACNKLPKINFDGGIERRARVVEHTQKFVDEPTKPNEHPKDPELRGKLKTWHKPFMWLLLNIYYPIYKKYGIDKLEPACVKLSTQKYKQDSNVYFEFKEEFIQDSTPTDRLSKNEMWEIFKEWHTNNYNDRKLPSTKDLFKYFEENGYEKRNNFFCGITFKERVEENNGGLD